MEIPILPLAVTMVAGPQIVSSIILVTGPRAVRVSLAFLAGVAVALVAGVTAMFGVAAALDGAVDLGSEADAGSAGNIVKYVLLLHRRATHAMPRLRDWMNTHSWLINIAVCALFIVLIVSGA